VREPFHTNAERLIELCICGHVQGFLASHTILNVFYIIRKDYSIEKRKEICLMLCKKFNIIDINRTMIVESLQNNDWDDLEDGLQMHCAMVEGLDYIITRDINGFKSSKIQVLSPEVFLNIFENETDNKQIVL